ncbi:hypothetical protein ACFL6S_35345, partial [Candidatus Poribacteria bacterium]
GKLYWTYLLQQLEMPKSNGIVLMLSAALMSCSAPQQSIEVTNSGTGGEVLVQREEQTLDVRWDIGYIAAEGKAVAPTNAETEAQGKLLAREGAILNARQRLLEEIEGVHVDGVTTMINLMANNTIRGRISGYVMNAHVIQDSERWEEGVYSVQVRIPRRSLASVAYSGRQTEFSMQTPVFNRATGYTGLIVNAGGMSVTESMIFNIITDTGALIYGPSSVSFSVVQNNTMATFAKSLELARRDSRVTGKPMVIRAMGTRGVDIVISQADSVAIKQSLQKYDFLNAGRVVIVTD